MPYDSLQALLERGFLEFPMSAKSEAAEKENKKQKQSHKEDGTTNRLHQDSPISSFYWKPRNISEQTSARFQKYRPKMKRRQQDLPEAVTDWVGGFGLTKKRRDKRKINVVNRNRYNMTKGSPRTPWGQVARILKNVVQQIKGKKEITSSVCNYNTL